MKSKWEAQQGSPLGGDVRKEAVCNAEFVDYPADLDVRVSLPNMVVHVSHTLRVVQGIYKKRQVWNKRGEESKLPAGKKDQRTQVNTAPHKKME
eukprot:3186378-Pleurochrysis_carterae.AAC.1